MDDSTAVINETLASQDPTPSQVAVAREQWTQMLAGQPSQCRQVCQMRLSGETHITIAERLGISQKTVQRMLNRMLQERERS
jgi:DNA-directed RNA polymerase specialized sigma24 family protein